MAKKVYEETNILAMADKIRELTGEDKLYTTTEMASIGIDEAAQAQVNKAVSGIIDGTITAELNLSEGITKIRDYIFYNCYDMKMTSLPSTVTEIGERAFSGCTNMDIAELPAGLTTLSEGAFASTDESLKLHTLPEGITVIPQDAFFENTMLGNRTVGTTEKFIFPASVEQIDDGAFQACYRLWVEDFPSDSNLKSIGNYAFAECHQWRGILPNKLESIGIRAFYNCMNWNLTTIPASVQHIGSEAMMKCTSITTLTFKGTPTFISSSAFSDCVNLKTINVPWASGAVANAPWGATNATINYNVKV